jgi:hypothetical protein
MGRTYTGISPRPVRTQLWRSNLSERSQEVRNSNPARVKAGEEVQKVWNGWRYLVYILRNALYFYQAIQSLRDRRTVKPPYILR